MSKCDREYIWSFNPYPSSTASVRRKHVPEREWRQTWVFMCDTIDKKLVIFGRVWSREVPVYEMQGDSPHCVGWKWEYSKADPRLAAKAAMHNRLNGF